MVLLVENLEHQWINLWLPQHMKGIKLHLLLFFPFCFSHWYLPFMTCQSSVKICANEILKNSPDRTGYRWFWLLQRIHQSRVWWFTAVLTSDELKWMWHKNVCLQDVFLVSTIFCLFFFHFSLHCPLLPPHLCQFLSHLHPRIQRLEEKWRVQEAELITHRLVELRETVKMRYAWQNSLFKH